MAEQWVRMLVSDIDGKTPADRTVKFGWGGKFYAVDLPKEEADKFEYELELYSEVGLELDEDGLPMEKKPKQPAKEVKVAPPQRKPAHNDKAQNDKTREWAKENGYQVNGRAKVPDHIQAAFQAAHTPEAMAERTAAKPPVAHDPFSVVPEPGDPKPRKKRLFLSAEEYVRIYNELGGDTGKIAERLGVSLSSVYNRTYHYRKAGKLD